MEDFYTTADSYLCMEQYMMAGKAELFGDEEIRDQILEMQRPKSRSRPWAARCGALSRRYGTSSSTPLCCLATGTNSARTANCGSFSLSTGDSVLVEASPYDAIWGIRLAASFPEAQDPMKWRGQNLLGFALMEVRDELRRVTQNEMLCDWVWYGNNETL